MKYHVIHLSLFIILVYGLFSNTGFPIAINIVLLVSILLTNLLWKYSILITDYEADYKMQSQRKAFELSELAGAAIISFFLWFFPVHNHHIVNNKIVYILAFWISPVSHFILWLVYKKKKNYTIFIKDNEFFFKTIWTKKRNLAELTQIRYDRLNKKLCFVFKSKPEISIKTTLYKTEELQKLLKILIEKSENDISIPKNYHPKIAPIAETVIN